MLKYVLLIFQLSSFSISAQTIYKCPDDVIIINGNTYPNAGVYNIKYIGSMGQDSIVAVDIVDYKDYHNIYLKEICVGEKYLGVNYFQDTTLIDSMLTINGCDSITITEIDVQVFVVDEIFGKTHICKGDTTELSVGFYSSYLWSDGSSNPKFTVTQPGNIGVTITNNIGCTLALETTTTMSDVSAIIEVNNVTCKSEATGSLQVLSPKGGYGTYQLLVDNQIRSSLEQKIDGLFADTYSIIVKDSTNCTYLDTIEIVEPDTYFELEIVPSVKEIYLDDTVIFSIQSNHDIIDYLWNYENKFEDSNQEMVTKILYNNTVYLEAIDKYGCKRTADFDIDPIRPIGLIVPNIFSPNEDGNNDIFFIRSDKYLDKIESISIYDRHGNLILDEQTTSIEDFEWDGKSNGQKATSGNYLVTIVYSYRGDRLTYTNIITVI